MDFKQITISGVDGKTGLNRWEGRVPYMYLDNRKINDKPAPLVTVGVGCAIPLSEAVGLPFKQQNGTLALPADITKAYTSIQNAPFGMRAAAYKFYTSLYLENEDIDALIDKRFVTFIATLKLTFPKFDTLPETAKAGCLDLIYGLGVSGFNSSYRLFKQALNQTPPNFKGAALQCGANANIAAFDDRNQARKLLFLAA